MQIEYYQFYDDLKNFCKICVGVSLPLYFRNLFYKKYYGCYCCHVIKS
jgi:hypothetical protein